MKINFTKKEYELLIEMIGIAQWIIKGYQIQKENNDPYEELEQRILSYVKDFHLENLVVFDRKLGKYFTTREFEDSRIMKHIEEYENNSFWEELIEHLAERDLIKQYGEEHVIQMDPFERFSKLTELEEKYSREFEQNGLDNVIIKHNQQN